jgi:hypothetical protein
MRLLVNLVKKVFFKLHLRTVRIGLTTMHEPLKAHPIAAHRHCLKRPIVITIVFSSTCTVLVNTGRLLKRFFACFCAIFTILVNLVASSFCPLDVTFTSYLCHKSMSDVQAIQEGQNQMVLGLGNNPVDPYIIRKLQP